METISYIRSCLDLGGDQEYQTPASPIIRSFRTIGTALCNAYSVGRPLALSTLLLYGGFDSGVS